MNFTYLWVDILSVLVPFLFSFHPKIQFYKEWKRFIPVCLIVATFFIAWDILYTHLHVWSFNEKYVTGIYIGNLPIEELLFFICIPYACIFSYFVLKQFLSNSLNISKYVVLLFSVLCMSVACFFPFKLYTAATFGLLGIALLFIYFKYKWFDFSKFFIIYIILLIPFFITNGILTGSFIGREIVSYDNNQNLGIRLLTIPFEDIFYGMLLILLNVVGYEFQVQRKGK